MTKIIMFTGGNETQEYFTLQMSKAFMEMGHAVFLYNLQDEGQDFPALLDFIEDKKTVMITFNFQGLNFEDQFYNNDHYFWETEDIPCYNIVLDHPFYYHKFFDKVPPQYIHISIDLGHENYMKRFFPNIKLGPFLPLAGTGISNKPFKERCKDIVFTGNYNPHNQFNQYINRIDDEYASFYQGIIDDLIARPSLEMDEAFETHVLREIKDASIEDLKQCMENMIFIDLYVRFYFRGLAVRTLAENGFRIHVYGAGWEYLDCKYPKNIIIGGPQNSLGCLYAIADSKISLNVMPWFKKGGHDRVFNSILNGALCLSDDSLWLRENLKDGEDIVYYSLAEMDQLPSIAEELLSNPTRTEQIIQSGYQKASALHTWAARARVLSDLLR